ncbi:hypothetical protein EV702DRAFT_1196523 [Suillus placidus]|uniref:Uncharacterized protein n=1 Tax=Suillus placidus TaxID=48579 RepID=A0A9P7D3U8_9AGAM|nr:hypothetical protein EV702DRAFT_1196523 [Suillus placidus]
MSPSTTLGSGTGNAPNMYLHPHHYLPPPPQHPQPFMQHYPPIPHYYAPPLHHYAPPHFAQQYAGQPHIVNDATKLESSSSASNIESASIIKSTSSTSIVPSIEVATKS